MARETLINSSDDMKWLRDVHLPRLPSKYRAAVIVGNEDYPDRIEVYERRDPLVTDAPVVFVADEEGVFRETKGTKGARHHATVKAPTWERVATVSSDWHADANAVASDLADAVERKFGVERMIEGAWPNYRVLAKGDEKTLEKARVFAGQWLAEHEHQASQAGKRTRAQLDRDIAEALERRRRRDA